VKLPETTVDPTDDVIFGFTLDDTANNRGIPLSWTMKFDDVLDGDKLNESLTRLLSIGNWRKVGGRLRLNVRFRCSPTLPTDQLTKHDSTGGSWRSTSPRPSVRPGPPSDTLP